VTHGGALAPGGVGTGTRHHPGRGAGLDPDLVEDSGMGILGMRERALLLGASITVERAAERGTLVRVDFSRSVVAQARRWLFALARSAR
jgi:signal transduction histidine kinase